VNVIRNFRAAGRGVLVWSARTMASDPEWKYVHIRRLFIYLEQSIQHGTQWVVFEPNSEPTWTAVRTALLTFLQARWSDGAFAGSTPDEAYFVKCDRTTMTQDDIDNGRLVALIGVAPLRPAEFVIFRIGQWTADARP
jgi:phage tail sheath protein FI